ncbi:hypothetical protein J2S43_005509 [Catenuloplanes nepalensis]|uniref:DUF624 domain-containing protein n=1 Tax=Catenuloplanes nepalensis TaxID=587533 RepID=A0ABT9MZX6_9ACTN|nr:hypothetical protein [Catenuloplanes nepalensis]MDP9796997.1 hypothetical protein [Catenuloplanes nepalensis]
MRQARGERLALFAECVLAGLLTLIAAVPLVTLLPALGAGCDHIAAHLDGRSTALSAYPRRLLMSFRRGGLGLGALLVPVLGVLTLDLLAVRRGLPGAAPVAVICAAATITLLVVVLRAAAVWRPGGPSWPVLLRDAAVRARADPAGSLLLVGGLGMLIVCTWQLPPLVIPALGCLLMGGVAVERRIS